MLERKNIPPRIPCQKCEFFTQSSIQRCFFLNGSVTRTEIQTQMQMKQCNHSVELSASKSTLPIPSTSVSKSTLTMPTITPRSVSQSPLTEEKILEVYANVFNGLETFPGKPYKFWLKENYVPAQHAPRKVPIHLQDDYKLKLEHHKSFNAIKRELSTNIVLLYYDPTSPTTLQTDRSKKGLRAVLIQNDTPIFFASRAILTTEANYQNLKLETLAMIWGMQKFHYFLYGNEFTLETDRSCLFLYTGNTSSMCLQEYRD